MGSSSSTEAPAEQTPISAPPKRVDAEREQYLAQDNQHLKDLQKAALKKLERYAASGNTSSVELCRFALKEIPSQLLSLNDVIELDLSFNRIDTLPEEFCAFKTLTQPLLLYPDPNFLREKVDHFSSTLQKLIMSSTWFQKNKLTNFSKLQHLTHLDISWSWLCHLDWVSSLVNLRHFNMRHGKYQGTLDLSALHELRHLDISENEFSDFPKLSTKSKLRCLKAAYNSITLIPTSIGDLAHLRDLDLSFNRLVMELPASIANLKKLKHFNMGGITVAALPAEWGEEGAFPSLSSLSMQLTKMTEFPKSLFSITSLRKLEFFNNKVSSIPEGLGLLSNLEALSLRFNDLTDLPSDLFSLPNLTFLEIGGNDLTSLSSEISKLSKLTYLDVSFNKLKSLPLHLSQIQGLVHLHIAENPLDDKSLLDLAWVSRTAAAVLSKLSGKEEANFLTSVNEELFGELPSVKLRQKLTPSITVPEEASSLSAEQLRDKIFGLILGNAIGDAMGISTEFMRMNEAAVRYGMRNLEYDDIVSDRHRGRFRRGDFTDDTDQMLLILNNLISNGLKRNINDFADDLLRWANTGAAEFGDNVGWGIGATVSAVLETPGFKENPHKAAKDMWEKAKRGPAANGAVMRTSTLGVPSFWDDTTVCEQTLDFCLVTHADHRCQASCVAVTLAIAKMLRGASDIPQIVSECHEKGLSYIEKDTEKNEFTQYMTQFSLAQLELWDTPKIGYTLKTLGAAFWALKNSHLGYKTAMMRVFQQAGDADTNGAVAGALLGCHVGLKQMPKSWVDGLIHKEYLFELAEKLCVLLGI